tara:strand:- start:55 stop:435 length:381 start_codon:yes stop_codon:yes gene_type:complete
VGRLGPKSLAIAKKFQEPLFITTGCVFLMRIIKSVSLPLRLAQKVEQIPNFSAYVASAIETDNIDAQNRHIVALKRALARSHETMRLIQQLPQQTTRKAYIRSVFNLIDDRHGLDLERDRDGDGSE